VRKALEDARTAVLDMRSAERQLKVMGTRGDRMAARRRESLQARIARDEERVNTADSLLLGGTCAELDPTDVDILYHRYVNARTWEGVSYVVGLCPRTCQYRHDRALAELERISA
jgi:hypothetical protein